MEYQVVTPSDPKYPKKLKERLGANCPPKLYYHGPLEYLDHFTLTTISSDKPVGAGIRAFWDPLFTILEYQINHLGGWYSVLETEMFFKTVFTGFSFKKERYYNYVSLFSSKGLAKESYADFLKYRFYPPFDKLLINDEYFRRAKEGELLMLSLVDPDEGRQLRKNIMERNYIACCLADLVYIPWAPKGSKTYTLAKRVVQEKIPVFTAERELFVENRINECVPDFDCLHKLGIPGYNRKTLKPVLEKYHLKPSTFQPPKPIVNIGPEAVKISSPVTPEPIVKEPIQREICFKKPKSRKK